MTNSIKEISFSGHTHSEYALTSHTHSNYALTSHTHSGYASTNHTHSQYVTEVDINQMIEDAIDSYVPTIQTMGQVGMFSPTTSFKTTTITVLSSVKVFAIYGGSYKGESTVFSVRMSNRWRKSELNIYDLTVSLESNNITLTYDASTYYSTFYYFYL